MVGGIVGACCALGVEGIGRGLEAARPVFRCGTSSLDTVMFLIVLGGIVAFVSRPPPEPVDEDGFPIDETSDSDGAGGRPFR